MRSVELGEFLRSRRERIDPQQAGLPGSGRRRAPGLRREELASLAGVTASWVARLEQGKAQGVSGQVLGALARALQLDDLEQVHLFALAGLRVEARAPAEGRSGSIDQLLRALEPSPAYLLDRAWNIVAWNAGEALLFPAIERAEHPNLLELVFTDPAVRQLIVDHDAEAAHLVSQFRAHCTDWPGDPGIDAVVDRLTTTSPYFARLWASHDVAPLATTRRVFEHPRAGRLELDHHRLGLLDRAGTILVVYVDAPGSDSVARLAATSS